MAHVDQTSLTFDLPYNSTGNEKNQFTVTLVAYAGVSKMPSYVIFKRKMLPKNTDWLEVRHFDNI